MRTDPFLTTALPLEKAQRGKVRDSYLLGNNQRLLITTDRLSAFDKVLHGVSYKGQVLNQLSAWWFSKLRDIIPHHLISLPDPNAMVALDVKPFPVEVIVRGYISGVTSTALWHLYSLGERSIYGYDFPEGLKKNQKLPEPIITPTTKGGPSGHDERLTCDEVVERGLLAETTWNMIKEVALKLFKRGQELADKAALLLVDTKYEFGYDELGQVFLIDEVHTPDSSRFWGKESYADRFMQGLEPENFDKEMVRLAYDKVGYRGEGAPPNLPDALWQAVSERYIQIYERLTGMPFIKEPYPVAERLHKNLIQAKILEASHA